MHIDKLKQEVIIKDSTNIGRAINKKEN